MTALEVHNAVAQEIDTATANVLPWFELPRAQIDWLPEGDRWTVAEILHHITLTSHYLLILIEKAGNKCLKARLRGEQLDWPTDYALIPLALQEAGALDAFTWQRPDHMDPRLHPSTGDVQALFTHQMQQCKTILEELKDGWGIWSKTTMSVNDLGKLDVYQFIVFLCKHAQRHCGQMARNLAEMNARQ